MDKTTFGTRIRRLREEHSLTQAELAQRAGINAVHLGRIERGEVFPRPRTRRHLAEALDIDVKNLLREEG